MDLSFKLLASKWAVEVDGKSLDLGGRNLKLYSVDGASVLGQLAGGYNSDGKWDVSNALDIARLLLAAPMDEKTAENIIGYMGLIAFQMLDQLPESSPSLPLLESLVAFIEPPVAPAEAPAQVKS